MQPPALIPYSPPFHREQLRNARHLGAGCAGRADCRADARRGEAGWVSRVFRRFDELFSLGTRNLRFHFARAEHSQRQQFALGREPVDGATVRRQTAAAAAARTSYPDCHYCLPVKSLEHIDILRTFARAENLEGLQHRKQQQAPPCRRSCWSISAMPRGAWVEVERARCPPPASTGGKHPGSRCEESVRTYRSSRRWGASSS